MRSKGRARKLATSDGSDDFAPFPANVLDDVCSSNEDPTLSSTLAEDPLSDDELSPHSIQQSSVFFTQNDLTIPLDFELRESSVPAAGLGIWSRRKVDCGERFGPYEGEHSPCLHDPTQGWEVRMYKFLWRYGALF
ncbi:histone-lysine N-methyltransferase MECOM [Nematolebias whitei]|uniref:histone-lysine N-methyltransferase MECOM n=1 Tax=Nematolebias whitei TaxID=451745 RepID=UPI00189BACA6|nr:histone-lysine N-methyltransferase MECOM [Nematolebias whitei]